MSKITRDGNSFKALRADIRARLAGFRASKPSFAEIYALTSLIANPALNDDYDEFKHEFMQIMESYGVSYDEALDLWLSHARRNGSTKIYNGSGDADPQASPLWIDPEPLPLIRAMEPAPEYPVEALGGTMAAAARAMHLEAVEAPLAVCCNSLLAAASLATQGHYNVELPFGSIKPISLFILSILETGGRKSRADELALEGVVSYEAMLRASHDAKDADYKNRLDAWKGERLKITRKRDWDFAKRKFELDALGPEPVQPPYPIIRYTEPSIEGLIQTLRFGHPSAGLFTTEGGQFISGHNMADTAVKRRATGALNRFWDGETADRIRVGEKFILVGRRVCAHLLAQPDVAYAFTSDRDLEDNGFLSRWLVSAPDSIIGSRFSREVSIKGKIGIEAFNKITLEHLQRELPYAEGSLFELKPKALPFSEEAKEIWWRFRDKCEIEERPGGRLAEIKGFANKLPEHAARIAAVLAAFEGPERRERPNPISADAYAPIPKPKPPPKLEIDAHDIERGIRLANYYAAECLRLKTMASVSLDLINAQKLLDWLREHWKDKCVTVALLVANGPGAFRGDTQTMKQLVHILERHKWLIPMEEGTIVRGKKRKEAWEVNQTKPEESRPPR